MSLEDIREKKQGKGVYIIIGLLLVGMAGFGTSQFGTGSNTGDEAVLTARDTEISVSEYQNTLRSLQQRNPNMSADNVRQLALGTLQQRAALLNYLDKNPLAASNKQMDFLISRNPMFFDNGKFSDEAFRRATRVAPEVYRASLSKDIAIQELQQSIATTGVISQSEINPYVELSRLTRDILVAKIARSNFSNIATDAEIQSFYDKNKSKYMTEEMVDISYIDLNPTDIMAQIEVSESDVLAAAQPIRKAKYHVFPNEQVANNIYQKFESGIDKKDLLQAIDKASEDSGDLGKVAAIVGTDALIPQSAADAIYALKQTGDLTAPIVVEGSVYLFELSEKSNAEVTDTDKARIKSQLQEKKSAPKIATLHEKMNTAVFDTQSPTLDSISLATALATITESGVVNGQGILALPELVEAIQASDKKINKLQEPVTIGERVIIYQLNSVKAPKQMPLDAVRSQIEQTVINEKNTQQLVEKTQELVAQAKKDTLAAAVLADNYPTQNITKFTGKVEEGALLDPVAAMMIMRELPKLGDENAAAINSPSGDSYVYVTTDVHLDNSQPSNDDVEAVASVLSNQVGQLELGQFLQSITEQADIRVNPSLVK